MIIPTLTTQRLTLRPLTKATQRQVDWLRDKEATRFSEQRHKEHTLSTQNRYVSAFHGYLWGVYSVKSGEHIGNISAVLNKPNNTADVGIMLGFVNVWGNGYGYEAWLVATNWLLNPYEDGGRLRKLEAGCAAANIPMKRILEKSKFVLEGERKNSLIIDNAPCGVLLYGRFK